MFSGDGWTFLRQAESIPGTGPASDAYDASRRRTEEANPADLSPTGFAIVVPLDEFALA